MYPRALIPRYTFSISEIPQSRHSPWNLMTNERSRNDFCSHWQKGKKKKSTLKFQKNTTILLIRKKNLLNMMIKTLIALLIVFLWWNVQGLCWWLLLRLLVTINQQMAYTQKMIQEAKLSEGQIHVTPLYNLTTITTNPRVLLSMTVEKFKIAL